MQHIRDHHRLRAHVHHVLSQMAVIVLNDRNVFLPVIFNLSSCRIRVGIGNDATILPCTNRAYRHRTVVELLTLAQEPQRSADAFRRTDKHGAV